MDTNTPKQNTPAPRRVADRDLELVERLARDVNELARAIKKGDREKIIEVRNRLSRSPDEMARVLLIARRAYARE